jgi:chromosome partitioning protein
MNKIFAVANQKGGVGKTTTTINLAASIALADRRVLVVDLDPQSNLTSGVGMKEQVSPGATIYEALASTKTPDVNDFILETEVSGLSLLPADRNLTGAQIELLGRKGRERLLQPILQQASESFDYILIDTPPSLGILTLNALVAAEAVLIPLQPEYFALEGVAELTGTIDRVQQSLNASLEISGVLLTMMNKQFNLAKQVESDVRGFFGDKVFKTTIPRNVKLAEAPSHGLPAMLYDVNSTGALAYVDLAREFLKRHRPRRRGEIAGG